MIWTPEQHRFRDKFDAETRRKFGAGRVQQLLEKRRPGDLNDNASVGPGARVVLKDIRYEGERFIEDLFEIGLKDAQKVNGMNYGYAVDLPDGGFVAEPAHVELYSRIGPKGELNPRDWLLAMRLQSVIRIEGAHGELFQSLLYQPDGRPRNA